MTFCFNCHCHFEAESVQAALTALSQHFAALASSDSAGAAASMVAMHPDSQMSLMPVSSAHASGEVLH